MYKKILKRCGVVLIVVGAVDIAYMIWVISKGQSYSSSFNIFAVIGGVFLLRGSLKVARWIAMLASFMLVACVGMLFVMPLMFPLGYWIAVFRNGSGITASAAVVIAMLALLYWLRRELQSPEIARAQTEAGLKHPKVVQPIVAGILLPIFLGAMLTFMLRGDTAREAVRRAEQQLGTGYHYVVTNLQMQSNMQEKSVSAIVAAYNDSELKTVRIAWKE